MKWLLLHEVCMVAVYTVCVLMLLLCLPSTVRTGQAQQQQRILKCILTSGRARLTSPVPVRTPYLSNLRVVGTRRGDRLGTAHAVGIRRDGDFQALGQHF